MTDEEFRSWWASKSISDATGEKRVAWRAFLVAFDREHDLKSDLITDIPEHAREQFIAAYTLIFG